MTRAVPLLLISGLASAMAAQAPSSGVQQRSGNQLQPGMVLVYASGGSENPPWLVEAVARDTALGGMANCSVVRIRTAPARETLDVRAHCVRGDTLFGWDAPSAQHRVLRPIAPNMTVELSATGGRRIIYETRDQAAERIDGLTVTVVHTTVTTFDSTGRAVRRLRERYAVALGTATGGTFEAADSASAGGWRTERAFELVRVGVPAPARP